MKKRFLLQVVILFLLCLLTACGGKTDAPAESGKPAASEPAADGAKITEAVPQGKINYLGGWRDKADDKIVMTVIPTRNNGAFAVLIRRSDSALETTEWAFSAIFNKETGELDYTDGAKYARSYSEDGKSVAEDQLRADCQGTFRFNDANEMEWQDGGEDFSAGCRFERTYAKTPSESQITEEFYRFVSHLEEGTAGASLKQASAACKVVEFAERCELWNVNPDELRTVMPDAWQKLTDAEREGFSKNFSGISHLMSQVLSTSEGDYTVFDDAGVGNRMRELMDNDFARFAWATLLANMMTMGG